MLDTVVALSLELAKARAERDSMTECANIQIRINNELRQEILRLRDELSKEQEPRKGQRE